MLVYDITNIRSFQTLQKWHSTLNEVSKICHNNWCFTRSGVTMDTSHHSVQEGLLDISTMVVGNKADLEELRTVPKETAEQVDIEVKQGVHVYKLSCILVCHSKLQNPKH